MTRRQMQRSEETKMMILKSAGTLFTKKGYDSVTIREIAKEAGCSHTTIYLYFKDKEALLHELSMPSLQELHQQVIQISNDPIAIEEKLKKVSLEYLHFCLGNRSMYDVFFNAKSTKVDEDQPELEINKLRLDIFRMMKSVIQEFLKIPDNEQLLAFSRIYYYNLNGILSTYSYRHETLDVLMERLTPTFELAVDILLLGFKEKINRGGRA